MLEKKQKKYERQCEALEASVVAGGDRTMVDSEKLRLSERMGNAENDIECYLQEIKEIKDKVDRGLWYLNSPGGTERFLDWLLEDEGDEVLS